MLNIIGLGNEAGDLSLAAHNCIRKADCVIAKTNRVRSFGYFAQYGIPVRTLDGIFEKSRSYRTLYRNLADEVAAAAKEFGEVCYCVEGSGLSDRSVAELFARKGLEIRWFPAAEKSASLLAECPASSVQSYAASDFVAEPYLECDRKFPVLLREVDSAWLAGAVKLRLADWLADEEELLFTDGVSVKKIPLYELDRQSCYGDACAVLLPPADLIGRKRFGFSDLIAVVVRLREPDGCPWDREQTHRTIRQNLLEEAYEALDAVEAGDRERMREELGDLLLQPVFHAVMAQEEGSFSVSDLLSELCGKLIFRHSHIFGADHAEGGEEALAVWEQNKAREKGQKTAADAIDDLPETFPAALYAAKVQKRAAKVAPAADRESAQKAFLSAAERFCALSRDADAETAEHLAGEMLFAAVDAVRRAKVDPELALRLAAERYADHVKRAECEAAKGTDAGELTEEQRTELWKKTEQKPLSVR